MWEFHAEAAEFIEHRVGDEAIRKALSAYLDYVIKRNK
jgi:octaprenyl-diphosphate synthase